MELDQIIKQVDWLDQERRKDQIKIGALEERLRAVDNNVAPHEHQIKELRSEITRLTTMLARMDTFDQAILSVRLDAKERFEEQEKLIKKRDEEAEKIRRAELRSVESALVDIRKELEQFPELKRSLKIRVDEESRLSRLIDEVRSRLETIRRSEEEYTRTIRLMDDGRRQDTKRLTDLTGEMAAVRKRVDDQIGRIELNANAVKKLEGRVSELATVEAERREVISSFLDSQNLREVERERVWKEWQARFQVVETQAGDVEGALQSLDATQRVVKRSQQAVDEMTQKVERRINEITEIQRLAEERFRQEWVTFKADDQKRWTNYTLTLEEQRNETVRQHEKLAEKVVQLEDVIQEIQDVIQQINEHTEKRLQTLLSLAHEWVTSYERTVGRTR